MWVTDEANLLGKKSCGTNSAKGVKEPPMYFLGNAGSLSEVIESPTSAKISKGAKEQKLEGCTNNSEGISSADSGEPIFIFSNFDKFHEFNPRDPESPSEKLCRAPASTTMLASNVQIPPL
jgi:hypothetical protein